jgi:hypothetical protein
VFTQVTGPKSSRTYLLDTRTGKLQLELSSQQPGYPFRLDDQVAFEPVKWASANSLYLLATLSIDFAAVGVPAAATDLYLLRDRSKDVSHQQSNLQFLANSNKEERRTVFDVTPDNQQLVYSANTFGKTSTLRVRPVAGGTFHTIYAGPAGLILARAISNTTILFIQAKIPQGITPSEETIWKINIDGSHLVKLVTQPDLGFWFDFADDMQPWSNLSRDGLLYSMRADGHISIVIGSLDGGPAKVILTPEGPKNLWGDIGVWPVGWSQL